MQRPCRYCGKYFRPVDPNQKFCKRTHGRKYQSLVSAGRIPAHVASMACEWPTKNRFHTREHAWKIIEFMYANDKFMNAYPCGDHWHLGHCESLVTPPPFVHNLLEHA